MRRFHVVFIACTLALMLIVTAAAQSPTTRIVHQDEFSIIGIEGRTSGEKEMSAGGIIPGMWQKFYMEGIIEKIPNKADERLYAVYTDFAGDRKGEYTVVIGARVKDKTQPPAGMVLKTIPSGKYAVLSSEKGTVYEVIPAAWMKIAALEDKDQLGGKRAYKADYEVYTSAAIDPQNAQADLYVSLK